MGEPTISEEVVEWGEDEPQEPDLITRIQAENARLREALDQVEDLLTDICPYFTGDDERRTKAFRVIRAALAPTTPEPSHDEEGASDGD